MKKPVTTIETFCDCCGEIAAESNGCLSCGKVVCFKCQPARGTRYEHSVYHGGTGDGVYCIECDRRLAAEGTNALYNAYAKIDKLKTEMATWMSDFEKRRVVAEAELQELL